MRGHLIWILYAVWIPFVIETGGPRHLRQQFKNRMGPVRSVFCKADTPPNRSPLLRWVPDY